MADKRSRYAEGRKYWAQLILATQVLGRIYWVHGKEREGELKKKDVLAKLWVARFATDRCEELAG